MDSSTKMSAKCKSCGSPLNINHLGPCPCCGQVGKIGTIEIYNTIEVKDSISYSKRREFYETNKSIKYIIIGIAVLSPFLGLIFSGIVGFVVGSAVGVLSYFISPYAITKVREIEHWNVK